MQLSHTAGRMSASFDEPNLVGSKKRAAAAQEGLFQVWRHHALFTSRTAPLVKAEKTHCGHAVIEQMFADLKAASDLR